MFGRSLIFVLNLLCFVLCSRASNLIRNSTFSICDKKNTLSTSELHRETSASVKECGSFCLNYDECDSASFSKPDGTCVLYSNGSSRGCDNLQTEENIAFLYRVNDPSPAQKMSGNANPCHFGQPYINDTCMCGTGFTGNFCENAPRDCTGLPKGNHDIYIYPSTLESTRVKCYGEAVRIFEVMDGVFDDANANWNDFKNGIQTATDDYWLGNEKIQQITNGLYNYTLYFVVSISPGSPVTSLFHDFSLGTEATGYALNYSLFVKAPGPPSADNAFPKNRPFQTYDHFSDSCVTTHGGAFWYPEVCLRPSPLLGQYPFDGSLKSMGMFTGFLRRQ